MSEQEPLAQIVQTESLAIDNRENQPMAPDTVRGVGGMMLVGVAQDQYLADESLSVELIKKSASNAARLHDSYLRDAPKSELFDTSAEAEAALQEMVEEIRAGDTFLAANMTVSSALRLLRRGQHDTYWEHADEVGIDGVYGTSTAQSKQSYGGDYQHYRRVAEQGLASYLPEGADEVDHPNYLYVDYEAQDSENGVGHPMTAYGNVVVRFKTDLQDPSLVYNFSDSFMSVVKDGDEFTFDDSRVLAGPDIDEPLAMMAISTAYNNSKGSVGSNLVRAGTDLLHIEGSSGYIEAASFKRLGLPDVESLALRLPNPIIAREEYTGLPILLKEIEQAGFADKLTILTSSELSELAQDWIAERYNLADKDGNEIGDDRAQSEQWAGLDLGVDSTADYDDVCTSLRDASEALARRVLPSRQSPPQELSRRRNFIADIMREARDSADENRKAGLLKLVAIENARYFFQK